MNRNQRVELAFEFMLAKEKAGEAFTMTELAEASGWAISSCQTYPTKRWHQFVQRDGSQYTSTGLIYLSKAEFSLIHSQNLQDPNNLSPKSILLHKAREFALLAVSTYNNPYTEFKTYGFIVNIVIAYTALFHAIFEKKEQNYFHLDEEGNPIIIDGEEKAWELYRCCNEYWRGEDNPETKNLNFLIGLRNKIEHRSLPAVDLATSGECQSALNNFENLLVEEFGDSHALMARLAIAMQLTRTSEQAQLDALKQFQTENYRVVREYMETYKNDLSDDVLESQKYRIRAFLVPKLGNHAKSADLAIEFINVNKLNDSEMENYERGVAFIKGIESPFKLKPGKVVTIVKEKIKDFNPTLHTKCWKYYNARPREMVITFKGEYAAYSEGFDGYLYSRRWAEFLIRQLSNKDEIARVRRQAI